jgi:drug/metabolite transporter (DMT)-like permease
MPAFGALLCLASAAAFGAMGVFGKLAYEEGSTVVTLLATRFVVAAILLWVWLIVSGRVGEVRRLTRRDVALALALGAIGYAAQAGGYFTALERLDASLVALVLYTYPAIVTVSAIVIGRESATAQKGLALVLASIGLILVLAGAASGSLDALGAVLALGAAGIYTVYILVSDGVAGRVPALALATLVCTGAAVALTLAGLGSGSLQPGSVSAAGWGWLGCLAVISTVGAIVLFFAGLSRVGPSTAAILSTLEPVVTVGLAAMAFGERLGPAQLAGAALVLSAAVVVNLPARRASRIRVETVPELS